MIPSVCQTVVCILLPAVIYPISLDRTDMRFKNKEYKKSKVPGTLSRISSTKGRDDSNKITEDLPSLPQFPDLPLPEFPELPLPDFSELPLPQLPELPQLPDLSFLLPPIPIQLPNAAPTSFAEQLLHRLSLQNPIINATLNVPDLSSVLPSLPLPSKTNSQKFPLIGNKIKNRRKPIKIYGSGTESRLPPVLELILQRIQKFFSVYKYNDTSRPVVIPVVAEIPQNLQSESENDNELMDNLDNQISYTALDNDIEITGEEDYEIAAEQDNQYETELGNDDDFSEFDDDNGDFIVVGEE